MHSTTVPSQSLAYVTSLWQKSVHPLQNIFLFNHTTLFLTKGLKNSYDITGTTFAAWVKPSRHRDHCVRPGVRIERGLGPVPDLELRSMLSTSSKVERLDWDESLREPCGDSRRRPSHPAPGLQQHHPTCSALPSKSV